MWNPISKYVPLCMAATLICIPACAVPQRTHKSAAVSHKAKLQHGQNRSQAAQAARKIANQFIAAVRKGNWTAVGNLYEDLKGRKYFVSQCKSRKKFFRVLVIGNVNSPDLHGADSLNHLNEYLVELESPSWTPIVTVDVRKGKIIDFSTEDD